MTNDLPQPIFLFSLPRSGSTILQRTLAQHPSIATAAEPWFLLQLVSLCCPDRAVARFTWSSAAQALNNYIDNFPNGRGDFNHELALFARRLYACANPNNCPYFLDKSPLYLAYARQILDTFPNSKAILLVRNPVSIISSMIGRWDDRFKVHYAHFALQDGLDALLDLLENPNDRVHVVHYEKLVEDSAVVDDVLHFLGLDPAQLSNSNSVNLNQMRKGSMGDRRALANASIEPTKTGQSVSNLNTWLRRRWTLRFLNELGGESLAAMGYDLGDCKRQVRDSGRLNPKESIRDEVWYLAASVVALLQNLALGQRSVSDRPRHRLHENLYHDTVRAWHRFDKSN